MLKRHLGATALAATPNAVVIQTTPIKNHDGIAGCPPPAPDAAASAPRWEDGLSSQVEDYLTNAQRCEALAKEARDAVVSAALIQAAQQWRDRASLLALQGQESPAALDKDGVRDAV